MFEHKISIRVRYAETDQMAYVYYGNYATYFEVARVEAFRALGCTYRQMEEDGVLMPVLEYKTKYIKPAYYDDHLTIKVTIKDKPGVRIKFDYEVYRDETLLTIAETTLVFISKENGKPCLPPDYFINSLTPFFEK